MDRYSHSCPQPNTTLLYVVSRYGLFSVVIAILDSEDNVDTESKDQGGQTALHWAAWNGHEAVVKLLLEKGAEPESKDQDGQTALHRAAENGHKAVVKLLLEKGAELKSKDQYSLTALHWAAWNGHEAVVRLL